MSSYVSSEAQKTMRELMLVGQASLAYSKHANEIQSDLAATRTDELSLLASEKTAEQLELEYEGINRDLSELNTTRKRGGGLDRADKTLVVSWNNIANFKTDANAAQLSSMASGQSHRLAVSQSFRARSTEHGGASNRATFNSQILRDRSSEQNGTSDGVTFKKTPLPTPRIDPKHKAIEKCRTVLDCPKINHLADLERLRYDEAGRTLYFDESVGRYNHYSRNGDHALVKGPLVVTFDNCDIKPDEMTAETTAPFNAGTVNAKASTVTTASVGTPGMDGTAAPTKVTCTVDSAMTPKKHYETHFYERFDLSMKVSSCTHAVNPNPPADDPNTPMTNVNFASSWSKDTIDNYTKSEITVSESVDSLNTAKQDAAAIGMDVPTLLAIVKRISTNLGRGKLAREDIHYVASCIHASDVYDDEEFKANQAAAEAAKETFGDYILFPDDGDGDIGEAPLDIGRFVGGVEGFAALSGHLSRDYKMIGELAGDIVTDLGALMSSAEGEALEAALSGFPGMPEVVSRGGLYCISMGDKQE
ncbi:hypothetical protein LTR50_007072 [Elasticomyces elasticus]|nr:hypothetical protein LTR50_007072 [Elasticomyces elasticus]